MSSPAILEPPAANGTILVTGLSGNVGRRLAAHLKDFPLLGIDLYPPDFDHPRMAFERLDLSAKDATERLVALMQQHNVVQVAHLAFVLDPWRTGALTDRRQWEINVGGTQKLLDAIEQVNAEKTRVGHMLYLSSVTSYGPDLPGSVTEDHPQSPHTYTYALHKKETDELCRYSHPRLNGCAVTVVRGHIFLGAGVVNFISNALKGLSNPHRPLGRWVAKRGWRLPLVLPAGKRNRGLYQFMHIEDSARVLAWLCRNYRSGRLEVLNLQGLDPPVTGDECAKLSGRGLFRIPSRTLVFLLYKLFWAIGLSAVPPDAFPYFAGSYIMDTTKLETLMGEDYRKAVRHTCPESILETVGKLAPRPPD